MAMLSLNYRLLATRLVLIPMLVVWSTCLGIYLVNDLLNSLRHRVHDAEQLSQLLAASATSNNAPVLVEQVRRTLTDSKHYESVTFFPVQSSEQVSDDRADVHTLLFNDFFGVSAPVTTAIDEDEAKSLRQPAAAQVQQIQGYMNITLNLKNLRNEWFMNLLPVMSLVFVVWFVTIYSMLKQLRRITRYFPKIEALSQRILDNNLKIDDYNIPPNAGSFWLPERALIELLTRQKLSTIQMDQLKQEQQRLEQENLHQIRQNSNLQNTLTHELKSGLHQVESGLQILQYQYISTEQKDAVDMITAGTEEVNAKLNQIIQMTRIDKGQAVVTTRQFSPTRLIDKLVERYTPAAQDKQLSIVSKIYHADYLLEGDDEKIGSILASLVENAVKFTQDGHIEIHSRLQHLEKQIRWTVAIIDTGIGIDSSNFKNIFEPFFQVDPYTRHSQDGNTVSLCIAKKLSKLLNGELTVDSELNKGSTFTLSLRLDDWTLSLERHLFSEKSFALWQPVTDPNLLAELLSETGANKVQRFDTPELLLDHLQRHPTDMVIISSQIDADRVLPFIQQLRRDEDYHRSLVLYNKQAEKLTPHRHDELVMNGVDYVKMVLDPQNLTESVKLLTTYLK